MLGGSSSHLFHFELATGDGSQTNSERQPGRDDRYTTARKSLGMRGADAGLCACVALVTPGTMLENGLAHGLFCQSSRAFFGKTIVRGGDDRSYARLLFCQAGIE